MTKGKSNVVSRPEGKVLNFDHLVFWVGNAKAIASYFVTRLGFSPLAVQDPSEERPVVSHAVRLNQITLVFESPTTSSSELAKDLAAHGDFVKDVAFEVHNLDELVRRAKEGGAMVVKGITEKADENGSVRYAVLRTYGDNTHTLIDRSNYSGTLLPGYKAVGDDEINQFLPPTNLRFIDHVEGNMADGTLEESVAWYEKNLNLQRFWCVDYKHDLVPYSSINSASVINNDETVLLSMNEAAKGIRPTSKASEFVKALGTAGVEHIALYTDDIVATMKSLKARGADILTWPSTYYDLIREKLQTSSLKVSEGIDALQENNILIDFDERGYMMQAFTKHVQARPTVFIEILQRKNHRGFGAMNYKWVFEAIERLEASKVTIQEEKKEKGKNIKKEKNDEVKPKAEA
ncbi:4-hydroxyphenylpyruvate dioxygenase [Amyelois transitella]|uniref:4-hydroxyphenylpyruvate dioxygenase n=1 Tax=Amyelois transitella TaxID=680683 RepID=UPI00067CA48A|nr:4-hydroxyphenylpyruvate dioxygenase [Amyelois transitella]